MIAIAKTAYVNVKTGEFLVDGAPFPWPIAEDGPRARKVGDTLHLVEVEIFAVDSFSHADNPVMSGGWSQPCISGIEFPWLISEDGLTYQASRFDVATVTLAFFADTVDGIPATSDGD